MNTATRAIPFQLIDWTCIEKTRHNGETGFSTWQTLQLPGLRIRWVEYMAGYLADHWCSRGHIVHCVSGEFTSELHTGLNYALSAGMSYVVSDDASSHRSYSKTGATLLIIDGDFLQAAM